MEEVIIQSVIRSCKLEELDEKERQLVEAAIKATGNSYAPYSNFHVGSAVLLENSAIVIGCNQENAAFPVTLCAERTALFSAGAQYPDVPVVSIAIAARNSEGLVSDPVTPCGSCRQALVEAEQRFKRRIRVLLYGTKRAFVVDGISNLLPLSFTDGQM